MISRKPAKGHSVPKPPLSSAGSAPLPPADFAKRALDVREVEPASLLRISRAKLPPLNFRASRSSRFDAPDGSFETLYAADSLAVCFAETLLRGDIKNAPLASGRTFIPVSELEQRSVVQLAGSTVELAVLAGPSLKRLGGDARISAVEPYDVPQRWSLAVYNHPRQVHGIIYMSRHDNTAEAIVLFDRARSRLSANTVCALIHHPRLGGVLDLFELAV